MSTIHPALVECLRLRQVLLVAGSRCSQLADLPAWPALARRLTDRVEPAARRYELQEMVDGRRSLAALAQLREELSDEMLAEVLPDAIKERAGVSDVVKATAQIPWRGIITTALDDLWSRAVATAESLPTIELGPGVPLDLAKLQGRFLLSLFGSAAEPPTVCLGARDVHAKIALTSTAKLLLDAHRRWSFVFVGFDLGDPDLTLLSRLLGASDSAREHFLLCPGMDEPAARAWGAELAVTAVPIAEDLEAALQALAQTWSSVEAQSRPALEDTAAWIELWTREPSDADAPGVIEAAAQRLRDEKSWDALVALLVQRAEISTDHALQVASLREMSEVFEKHLESPERAYRALVEAVRLEPENTALVDTLKRLARSAGLWDEFLRDYGSVVDTMADSADSARFVVEMGRIYAEESGSQPQAIAAFERALAQDPGSPEALEGLETLYRQTERWKDLVRILREREERDLDAKDRRRRRTERIDVLLTRLHDGAAAIEALEAAVAEDPDDRAALQSLEALYREERREPERLAVLEKLLLLASSDEERIGLLRRIAAGHRTQPEGADAALVAWERAFALGDQRSDTLEALSRVYEQRKDWRAFAAVLDRWAEATTEPGARAQLLVRAGRVYMDELADTAAGEERLAKALELEPRNPVVLGTLAALARERGDFFRAAGFMVEAEENTRNPLEKARLLFEAGVIHQDHLHDEARATELYARTLTHDPGHAQAATRLAPLYEQAEAWALLEPVLDMLARRAEGTDLEVSDLHRRLAECQRKLDKNEPALKSYEAARVLDPESLVVLRGLGDLLLAKQSWAEARAHYDQLLRLGAESLSPAEQVEVRARLARCAANLEEPEAARRWYEEAIALKPSNEERIRLWEELGDLCAERLELPDDAIRAFQETLALSPGRRQTLRKILDLYTEQKQWPGAVSTLAKLAGLESVPALRAKYHYTSAVIHRDELGNPVGAVELFNKALDDDPEMHKAFEAIERLLTEAQDWKTLARNYRKMIKRFPADGMNEARARVWNSLGVVSLRYLGDREAAVLALEVATSLDAEDLARRELLADLYLEMGPSALDKAVAEHQFLVSRRPGRVDSYRALAAAFQKMRAFDKLWCVAGALSYMGQADHYLHSFWERHRLADVPIAAGKFEPELWKKVVHPKEDPFIGALFTLLAPALALPTAQRHQTVGVRRNDKIDLGNDEWFPAVALRYLSTALDMALPDVFVHESEPQTVAIYNLRDRGGLLTPALVIGQSFQQWTTPFEVVFDLAKRMAFMRWERFPRFALMSPAALDIAVRAALALGGYPIGAGPHNGEVELTRSQLADLIPAPVAAQVGAVAKQFLEARGDVVDIPAWIAAADLSAARAAFVVSSDLPAAVRVLTAEPSGLTPVPLAERINDLLAYSVSDDYFAVRQALGLQVV